MAMRRSLKWTLLALAVGTGALAASGASGQGAAPAPPPAGVTACAFEALAHNPAPEGPAIRDAPRSDAGVLGWLPAIKDTNTGFYGLDGELPEFHVIGFKDGWFLIEGATYQEPYRPKLYAGQGWVDGKSITTHLFRETLKKAPDNTAPDAAYLLGTDKEGVAFSPYVLEPRILGCAGPWLDVELWLPGGKTIDGKPASADGTVRGWTDKSCTDQDNGPCRGSQFDYPWSPLPAGVTECNFGALSNDPDPAGLNVHEAPDIGARVVGRLAPPSDIGDGVTKVLSEVRVIGFRKGWFLVEAIPYNATDKLPKGPKPYAGRGWVAGGMLTTELLRNMLKQGPSEKSADVVDLNVEGGANPQIVRIRRILACSGDWLHIEVALEKGMKPLLRTEAPAGFVRGWANGTCTNQLTTCDFNHDTPWSPPAPLPPE
jgi:hypothetical protein